MSCCRCYASSYYVVVAFAVTVVAIEYSVEVYIIHRLLNIVLA